MALLLPRLEAVRCQMRFGVLRCVRSVFSILACAIGLVALALPEQGEAARDLQSISGSAPQAELVVYESESSVYCQLFRRDVLPSYERSPRSRRVPIRFIDVSSTNIEAPELAGPITSVPTVVYMIDGREEGRITGYVGLESFQKMVSYLLGPID